jgi:hypothetical protein
MINLMFMYGIMVDRPPPKLGCWRGLFTEGVITSERMVNRAMVHLGLHGTGVGIIQCN